MHDDSHSSAHKWTSAADKEIHTIPIVSLCGACEIMSIQLDIFNGELKDVSGSGVPSHPVYKVSHCLQVEYTVKRGKERERRAPE